MITEPGKRCQEMARIKDFASFKSKLLGAPDPSPNFFQPFSSRRLPLVFLPHLKNSLDTAMIFIENYRQCIFDIVF